MRRSVFTAGFFGARCLFAATLTSAQAGPVAMVPASGSPAIYQASYPETGGSMEERVAQTFQAALGDTRENALKKAVARLQSELGDVGTIGAVAPKDVFLLSRGRSGPDRCSAVYLVGIPVQYRGSGHLEEYGKLLEVETTLEPGRSDSLTIAISRFVDIVDSDRGRRSKAM